MCTFRVLCFFWGGGTYGVGNKLKNKTFAITAPVAFEHNKRQSVHRSRQKTGHATFNPLLHGRFYQRQKSTERY